MHETEYSKPLHWDNTDGWDAEAGGGGDRGEVGGGFGTGGHMYTHGWLMSMYGKNHHNIVK